MGGQNCLTIYRDCLRIGCGVADGQDHYFSSVIFSQVYRILEW